MISLLIQRVNEYQELNCLCHSDSIQFPFALNIIILQEFFRVEAAGNLSVVVGDSAYLSCKVESTPSHTTVTWFYSPNKENTSVSNATYLKLNIGNATTKYTGGETQNPSLFIRDVKKDDEGYFVCTAANSAGTGISKGAIQVTVLAGMCILPVFCVLEKGVGGHWFSFMVVLEMVIIIQFLVSASRFIFYRLKQ